MPFAADSGVCVVYVLGHSGADRTLTYVGWTNDLQRRIARHNAGTGARSTRGRAWVLLHTERFETRQQAMSREWHLKRDRAFRKRLALTLGSSAGSSIVCDRSSPKASTERS